VADIYLTETGSSISEAAVINHPGSAIAAHWRRRTEKMKARRGDAVTYVAAHSMCNQYSASALSIWRKCSSCNAMKINVTVISNINGCISIS